MIDLPCIVKTISLVGIEPIAYPIVPMIRLLGNLCSCSYDEKVLELLEYDLIAKLDYLLGRNKESDIVANEILWAISNVAACGQPAVQALLASPQLLDSVAKQC